jgi:hypothetical protein
MSDYGRTYIETQEEVIKIPLKQIRELGNLPRFVETISILPPPEPGPWTVGAPFLYLRVKTPWSPIVPPNVPLQYDTWDGFLNRMVTFMRTDADQMASIQNLRQ